MWFDQEIFQDVEEDKEEDDQIQKMLESRKRKRDENGTISEETNQKRQKIGDINLTLEPDEDEDEEGDSQEEVIMNDDDGTNILPIYMNNE